MILLAITLPTAEIWIPAVFSFLFYWGMKLFGGWTTAKKEGTLFTMSKFIQDEGHGFLISIAGLIVTLFGLPNVITEDATDTKSASTLTGGVSFGITAFARNLAVIMVRLIKK